MQTKWHQVWVSCSWVTTFKYLKAQLLSFQPVTPDFCQTLNSFSTTGSWKVSASPWFTEVQDRVLSVCVKCSCEVCMWNMQWNMHVKWVWEMHAKVRMWIVHMKCAWEVSMWSVSVRCVWRVHAWQLCMLGCHMTPVNVRKRMCRNTTYLKIIPRQQIIFHLYCRTYRIKLHEWVGQQRKRVFTLCRLTISEVLNLLVSIEQEKLTLNFSDKFNYLHFNKYSASVWTTFNQRLSSDPPTPNTPPDPGLSLLPPLTPPLPLSFFCIQHRQSAAVWSDATWWEELVPPRSSSSRKAPLLWERLNEWLTQIRPISSDGAAIQAASLLLGNIWGCLVDV